MLMVLCETPSRTTRVSPFYVVHGCDMDPGLLDTINFPKDKSSGSSQKETEAIPQNIVESKLVTIERMNKKPNRIHLQLQVGDQVLLLLGQRKTVEDDHFTVVTYTSPTILNTLQIIWRYSVQLLAVLRFPL